MTEAKAYEFHGWPKEGGDPTSDPHRFVLPLSGSTSDNWVAYVCDTCGGRGVALRHLVHVVEKSCPLCGETIEVFE